MLTFSEGLSGQRPCKSTLYTIEIQMLSSDGVICWERIHHLADIGLAWYGATGKANKAHRIQEPYCLEDLNQALGTAALHATKRIAGNMRVEFGPLHVLRARLNEVSSSFSSECCSANIQ